MKQLSLTSINNKAPLEVSLTPSGTFSFGTEKNNYIVGFVEDQTIVAIIEEFFVANDSAMLYICDVSDGKQSD